MTSTAAAPLTALRTRQGRAAPSAPPDSAAPAVVIPTSHDIGPAREEPSRGERLGAVALRVRRGMDSCSNMLMALALRLRPGPPGLASRAPPGSPPTAARLAELSRVARAFDPQSPAAPLEEATRLARRLALELLEVRRELQQTRLQLRESHVHEEHALHRAFHDTLTGLPNRVSFEEHSRRALALHEPQAREFGLMYIDLDGFKSINDDYGHAVGDELLKVIGARLTAAVRAQDSISRHGGDEFLGLLLDVQNEQQATSIARKLIDAVSAPCQLGPRVLCVRPSIGIALYPRDGITVEALLESADRAMFWAKRHRLGHALFRHVPFPLSSCDGAGQALAEPSALESPSLPGAAEG